MYTDNGHNYYLAEQQIVYNSWQLPLPQHTDCGSYPWPHTWTTMNNGQKFHEGNYSQILKTALTYGSAAVQKNYQADLSENNNQCPMNSTKSDYHYSQWNNIHAERTDSLPLSSLQNEKSIIPVTYNNPITSNNNNDQCSSEWNTHAGGADSFSSSNHQQQIISATYNNQFSSEKNDTHGGRAESNSSLSSNTMPYESLERYQQQNVQNNYGQNHVAYDARFNNLDPLTVSTLSMQHEAMNNYTHAMHLLQQKRSKREDDKKRKFACNKDNILGQERRSRQTYSAEQTFILEQTFQANEYVSREIRHMLAKQTKLDIKQIKIWFQNRRMKQKRNNSTKISTINTAPIPEASTLSNQEAQPQLQPPAVQHHEGYQNYSYSHQQYQQNIINQWSCTSNCNNILK